MEYILCALKVYPEIINELNVDDVDNKIAIMCINSMYNLDIY